MPVIFHAGRIAVFHHVPKTGGTSVEDFAVANYDHLGLIDEGWWSKSMATHGFSASPQHWIPGDIAIAIPPALVDWRFAVVRHPAARLVSTWRFNLGLAHRKGLRPGFSVWLDAVTTAQGLYPGFLDNHLRPQTELVPDDAEVFRLEDGFEALTERIKAVLGPGRGAVAEIPHSRRSEEDPVTLRREDAEKINRHYARDFERFGYDPLDPGAFEHRPFEPVKRLGGRMLGLIGLAGYHLRDLRKVRLW